MEKLLKDGSVFKLLERIDADLAAEARQEGCLHCEEGTLHRGDYKRQPRGGPANVMDRWNRRYSFCCSADGCRKRKTPPSVRFLGRKVYVGVVVVLVTAMMHGPNGRRVAQLHDALGIDKRTLKRWRQWWLEDFVATPFWKAERANHMPILDETLMPYCLTRKFKAKQRQGLVKLMRTLEPITIGAWGEAVAM